MATDIGDVSTDGDDDMEVASVLAHAGSHHVSKHHGTSTTPTSSKSACMANKMRAATVLTNVGRWNTTTSTPCNMTGIHSLAAYGETSQLMTELTDDRSVNAVDNQGMTALMWAAYFDQTETVAFLLRRGADTDVSAPETGATALILAASRGHCSCVELLLQASAEVNSTCVNGCTALHYAVNSNNPHMVAALLEWGADISWPNDSALSPYDLAYKTHNSHILSVMEKHMLKFSAT